MGLPILGSMSAIPVMIVILIYVVLAIMPLIWRIK